jgi:hypothetical protein
MDETTEDEQQSLNNEVLRKIGRNLLLFQQIEALLKHLAANSQVDGSLSDLKERQARLQEKVQKQMMGQLIDHYVGKTLAAPDAEPQGLKDISEPWIRTTFVIEADAQFREQQSEHIKLMLAERNDFVHHFLPRWRPDSLAQMMDAAAYLDSQREKVVPVLEHLKSVVKSMQEIYQFQVALFNSDEGERLLELILLQASPLVSLLCDIASRHQRPDGWTCLAHAGQLVRCQEREAVEKMKERYGHRTLKGLLVASELFEILDEPLPSGGSRTVYRLRK